MMTPQDHLARAEKYADEAEQILREIAVDMGVDWNELEAELRQEKPELFD